MALESRWTILAYLPRTLLIRRCFNDQLELREGMTGRGQAPFEDVIPGFWVWRTWLLVCYSPFSSTLAISLARFSTANFMRPLTTVLSKPELAPVPSSLAS